RARAHRLPRRRNAAPLARRGLRARRTARPCERSAPAHGAESPDRSTSSTEACAWRSFRESTDNLAQVSASYDVFLTMNPLAAFRTRTARTPQITRVLIVDDEPLYAEAISVLLGACEGIDAAGIAEDGQAG